MPVLIAFVVSCDEEQIDKIRDAVQEAGGEVKEERRLSSDDVEIE